MTLRSRKNAYSQSNVVWWLPEKHKFLSSNKRQSPPPAFLPKNYYMSHPRATVIYLAIQRFRMNSSKYRNPTAVASTRTPSTTVMISNSVRCKFCGANRTGKKMTRKKHRVEQEDQWLIWGVIGDSGQSLKRVNWFNFIVFIYFIFHRSWSLQRSSLRLLSSSSAPYHDLFLMVMAVYQLETHYAAQKLLYFNLLMFCPKNVPLSQVSRVIFHFKWSTSCYMYMSSSYKSNVCTTSKFLEEGLPIYMYWHFFSFYQTKRKWTVFVWCQNPRERWYWLVIYN